MKTEKPTLPFSEIREPLNELCVAVRNRLERYWPEKVEANELARFVVRAHVQTTIVMHETIRYFTADKPEDTRRKLEFAVSCPPLLRNMVESLCVLVFLFEDLQPRVQLFMEKGYRDFLKSKENHHKWLSGTGEGDKFLTSMKEYVERLGVAVGKTKQEVKDAEFPTPGRMTGSQYNNRKVTNQILKFIHERHYDLRSAEIHLGF